MRKRYRVLVLAAIAAALVVPVGFALSLEGVPTAPLEPHVVVATTTSAARVIAPIVVHRAPDPAPAAPATPLSDGATLLLVGTALVGIAAVVRRAG